MLFLLVMEVLNSLIHNADDWKLLRPFGLHLITHRVSLYADDLVIFASPEPRDLPMLRLVLQLFEESSRLHCNLAKCSWWLSAAVMIKFEMRLSSSPVK
jgi:hypothetical protein